MSIESVMPSSQLILCRPLQSIEATSNEYLGLISFRVDWLDLLAVQGTLKSLLCLHGRVEDSGTGRQAVKGMVLLQLVSQGCCNKCHKLGGFEQQKFLLA